MSTILTVCADGRKMSNCVKSLKLLSFEFLFLSIDSDKPTRNTVYNKRQRQNVNEVKQIKAPLISYCFCSRWLQTNLLIRGDVFMDAIVWWWCSPVFLWRHTAQCWRWNRTSAMSSSGFIWFLFFHHRLLLAARTSNHTAVSAAACQAHCTGGTEAHLLCCILGFIPFSPRMCSCRPYFLKINVLSLKQNMLL